LFNIEYDTNLKNAVQSNIKSDNNGNGNKNSYHQYEDEQHIPSNNNHHDDQPQQYSHGDGRSAQVYYLFKKENIIFLFKKNYLGESSCTVFLYSS